VCVKDERCSMLSSVVSDLRKFRSRRVKFMILKLLDLSQGEGIIGNWMHGQYKPKAECMNCFVCRIKFGA